MSSSFLEKEVSGIVASSHAFPVLGVPPAMGRAYTAEEDTDGRDQVLVVTHEFWQSRLAGRADVLGTVITADGQPREIIGVMPPGFTLMGQTAGLPDAVRLDAGAAPDSAGPRLVVRTGAVEDRVTLEQASSVMRTIMSALEQEAPARNSGWSVTLVPIHEKVVDQIRPALQVLSGAVALVLLIACVNVANLLLARSAVREQEIGVRSALGAFFVSSLFNSGINEI